MAKSPPLPIPVPADKRRPLRVLVIDDDETDRASIRRLLQQTDLSVAIDEAASGAESLGYLESSGYSCVLLDYYLPDINGLKLIEQIRAAAPNAPIVICTGRGHEDLAVEFMKAGASDYLSKSSMTAERLAAALRYAIELGEVKKAKARAEEELRAVLAERELLLKREHEARTRAEQATQSRDQLLAIVAHDLRNPIQVIMSAARRTPEPEAGSGQRNYAEFIQRAAREMDRLVRDLLDLSSLESGSFAVECQPVDLLEVIEEARESFDFSAEGRNLAVDFGVMPNIPAVMADRSRLLQVVGNLLSNALKFTPDQGSISVRAEEHDGCVEIAVQNTGPVIAPEQMPHIFDRFWRGDRSSRNSAGLGLAICKGIVEAHNGAIEVVSTDQEGTIFKVTLPVGGPDRH
ncbi:ATP-binding protein [Mesorhizobium sp. B2-1-5]|uniref:hybrid sensor histidine kinase/response regulator n=1 Tax=Mesorhizobium sp. B2-1-5 TaxID=2589969 RepID=UPI001127B6B3|nr:ATP-binding protein [Mesorhizobium sp. B2-1-5]TPM89487.1 response regulator [Mesorhizobium sp. B2-1-5]